MGSEVLDRIIERVHDRQRRLQHTWTTQVAEIAERLSWREPVLLGLCSAVAAESGWRIADPSTAISIDSTRETATALARDYLKVKFPRGARPWKGNELRELPQPFAPYFARPVGAEMLVYVDLKAAYWSITRAAGWDAVYIPGRSLGKRGDISDFPWPHHRLARNALVTVGFPTPKRVLHAGRLEEHPSFNPLLNLQLAWLVSDVLHALAGEAIREGAVCVHTDGYIFTALEDAERFMLRVREWGLQASIRCAGPGVVKAPGAWRIGVEESGTFRTVRLEGEERNAVREIPYARWLKRSFAHLVEWG